MSVIRDDLVVQEIEVEEGAANALSISLPARHNIFLVTVPGLTNPPETGVSWFIKLPPDEDSAVGDWAEFHVTNRPFDVQTLGRLSILNSDGNDQYPSEASLEGLLQYSQHWSGAIRKIAPNVWRVMSTGRG